MSSVHSRPSRLPISRVCVADDDATYQRELVYCERRSSTVPVTRCRYCEHCHAITRGDGGPSHGSVVCDQALSEADPASALILPRLSVADIMTRDVLCVRPSLSLDAAALILLEHPVKTLPVVDQENHVLGTICESDLHLEIHSGRSDSGTVESVMTPGALTVSESTPVTRAAAIMAFESVACLVIVSPAGEIVGVLSASDLLFWLARADGYLTRLKRCEIP